MNKDGPSYLYTCTVLSCEYAEPSMRLRITQRIKYNTPNNLNQAGGKETRAKGCCGMGSPSWTVTREGGEGLPDGEKCESSSWELFYRA